jgi:topoisomerase-4 subunit A
MDDGRFHKVANVIGHTMQYHPHGDASIGSALVVLACKEYFIDRQGNFGNILTGDPASAARYIECRLTPLAREVLFNPEVTEFADSYDGRNREPVTLPAKVPALLLLGAEGIAVGMTTRILPHNFGELLHAQIAVLRNRPFRLYPDFQHGGLMDVSEYDDGRGRIVLRALIEADSDKRLVIRQIPATTTTESLIASIEEAARRNKIKIAGISDYTAENVEIEILLSRGIYAEETIKQLYAYTDCQVSVPSTIMVIRENAPVEMTVSEVLRRNTDQLLALLRRELDLELAKLQERFHEKTLVQLFIEHRIYKRIEEAETYEAVVAEVRAGLAPYRDQLKREITDEDIDKLLQIQIRRISRFDMSRNREELEKIVQDTKQTRHHLRHLVEYAVAYIEGLLSRYGSQFPRRTRITDLEQVDAREVALRNVKVGHDRTNHFVGSEVRNSSKTDPPLLCSEFDRLVLLRNDGAYQVIPVPAKQYVGPVKYLLRADREQVYSILYRDRRSNAYYAKRFRIDRYIMDKEYTALPKNCLIEALYLNRGVVLDLVLKPNPRRSVDSVRLAFDEIELRSSGARGFKVTGYPVEGVTLLDRGVPQSEEPEATTEDAAQTPPAPGPEPPTAAPEAPGVSPAPTVSATAEEEAEEQQTPVARARQPRPAATPERRGGRPAPLPAAAPPAAGTRPRPAKAAGPAVPAAAPTSRLPAGRPGGEPPPPATPEPAKGPRTSRQPVEPATPRADLPVARPDKGPPKATAAPGPPSGKAEAPRQPPPDAPGARPKAKRPPAEDKQAPGKGVRPDALRRLIDEETPFFLE